MDWKSFHLEPVTNNKSPKLHIGNGKYAHCHGSISEAWVNQTLETKWRGIRLFVMDAVFLNQQNGSKHNFLLQNDMMKEDTVRGESNQTLRSHSLIQDSYQDDKL